MQENRIRTFFSFRGNLRENEDALKVLILLPHSLRKKITVMRSWEFPYVARNDFVRTVQLSGGGEGGFTGYSFHSNLFASFPNDCV